VRPVLREVRSALSFMTILPVGGDEPPTPGLGRACYPAVGLLLGAVAWGALRLAALAAPPLLAAAAAVAALAVLTGCLHLDGLADSADGLLAGAEREQRLAIMRDPRVGAFGVVALTLVLIGDVAALAGMDPTRALAALLCSAALARLAVVAALVLVPYVRSSGLGVTAAHGRGLRDLAVAAVPAAAPLLLDWRRGLEAAAAVALAGGAVTLLARRRIGGATGDVYGAVVEVGQLAGLVAFAVGR
jgi:adenosylcobinamide-GDP ribazoletransferase